MWYAPHGNARALAKRYSHEIRTGHTWFIHQGASSGVPEHQLAQAQEGQRSSDHLRGGRASKWYHADGADPQLAQPALQHAAGDGFDLPEKHFQ